MLGNLGSSKTTNAVRHMVKDTSGLTTYSNIRVKDIPNVVFKDNDSLIKEEMVMKGKKEKIKYSFNRDYWLSLKKPLNIVWDEAHFMADSREAMSQMNKAVTEFISMARRIIGFDKHGYGDFILITQRISTLDIRIRSLVTNIIYFILHWIFVCDNCTFMARWNSEKPNLKLCPSCNKRTLTSQNLISQRFFFMSIEKMNEWMVMGVKTYYKKDYITDISDYFVYFDTLQYLKAEKK